ncbi:Endoribonuclease L-PSP/chorismate mutase-like protein [Panaeolus papilionaceus]|nr:Endoribonuclease L-PSP/chorismate mutase-like protein [Panaeolus papilionaceus]
MDSKQAPASTVVINDAKLSSFTMVKFPSIFTVITAVTASVSASVIPSTHSTLTRVATTGAPPAIGPFSQGIKVGHFLYTSGAIPLDPVTGAVVAGGIEEQTIRALQNMKAVIEAAGSQLGKVVKTTIFLTDIGDYGTVNGLYADFFGNHAPARSLVQVARLPRDVLFEIEAVARYEITIISTSYH